MNFSKIRTPLQIVIEVSFFEVFRIRKRTLRGSVFNFSQLILQASSKEMSHNEIFQNLYTPSISNRDFFFGSLSYKKTDT